MTRPTGSPRQEDWRLLTGLGEFTDDQAPKGAQIGFVLRSPYPHAEIHNMHIKDALNLRDVVGVFTGDCLESEGIGNLPCASNLENRDGSPMIKPPRPVLARHRVRYVGEPVAFIVAKTLNAAMDAAELVEVNYEELPSTASTQGALAAESSIWEQAPNNVCYDWSAGNENAVHAQLENAAHVISIEVRHPRIAVTPIEPRSAIGDYDSRSGQFTLHVQTQGVHMIRRVFAEEILGIPLESLRVITRDVGGSFGMKIFPYPEYALVLLAARKLGVPVRWTATRSESFVSDSHGRARTDRARLGIDSSGKIVALEFDIVADLGAYLSYAGPSVPSVYGYTVVGHTYKIPLIHYWCRGVFTNAPPTDAYRGAGKPETVCTLEQLLDKAAFETGRDRIEIRRANLVAPEELPYSMPNGHVIDSGNFPVLLDIALQRSDWQTFSIRRNKAAAKRMMRGIGLGMYMHSTGGSPGEICEVRLREDGSIQMWTGTQSGGQGHQTTLAGIVAEVLEVEPSRVHVLQGDTDALDSGGGTGGSSLVAISGVTAQNAARLMLENTREAVSNLLEAAAGDIEYESGVFFLPGTDRRIDLKEVAARVYANSDDTPGCVGRANFEGINTTHPSGAYVAELECDPATGRIRIVQLVGVDDIGRVLFPMMADGQLHGSWAQSVGTSLMESVCFDEDDAGQPLTATLMDYQLPRADDLPFYRLAKIETLCKTNPLGAKGVGEVACLGAPGAIQNALSNLLSSDEFAMLDGPASSLRVWEILHRRRIK